MWSQAVGGDADWLGGGLQRVFNHSFFLAFTDNDADGIVFVRLACLRLIKWALYSSLSTVQEWRLQQSALPTHPP